MTISNFYRVALATVLAVELAACQPTSKAKQPNTQNTGQDAQSVIQPAPPVQKVVQLFGADLRSISRDVFRETLHTAGVPATREDDAYWVDTYNAKGSLKEAETLSVGYVAATGKFAFAEYTFPSFMDTQQVQRIYDMVKEKYGEPISANGDVGVGEVSAVWDVGGGFQIEVRRGWPSTTTFLTYTDVKSHQAMQAEIERSKAEKVKEETKAQSQAF